MFKFELEAWVGMSKVSYGACEATGGVVAIYSNNRIGSDRKYETDNNLRPDPA